MPFRYVMAALIALAVFALLMAYSLADEAEAVARDPSRGAWFQSLRMPTSGKSCCDISDCRQTEARQNVDGSWTAIVNGEWRPIPADRVLQQPVSIDGEAYVCNAPDVGFATGVIYCFVPPVPGF